MSCACCGGGSLCCCYTGNGTVITKIPSQDTPSELACTNKPNGTVKYFPFPCKVCDAGYIKITFELRGNDCSSNQKQFWYIQCAAPVGVNPCDLSITGAPGSLVYEQGIYTCPSPWSDQHKVRCEIDAAGAQVQKSADGTGCVATGITVKNVVTYWKYNAAPFVQCDCLISAINAKFAPLSEFCGINTNNFPRTE